jgi:hypothetical protein
VGKSLQELEKSWSPSKVGEDGRASYAVLKDGTVHFDVATDVDARLMHLRKIHES